MPITGAGQNPGAVAGSFALELDGVFAGWLSFTDGGYATAEVIAARVPGPDPVVRKHLGAVKYEDIAIACGTGMSKSFYDWLGGLFTRTSQPKNGAILVADFNRKELSRLNFFNSLITEIGFPALDASSKDAAKMTIKISPEHTVYKKGSGKTVSPSGPDPGPAKKWTAADFRLQMDGLDCTRVNKIDAVIIRQCVAENRVGQSQPASLDVSNLAVTLAESSASTFFDWHQDFVIAGNNGQGKEKHGTLDFLSPSLTDSLFRLTLKNLGIFKVSPEKIESASDAIHRVTATMYCEEMSFTHSAG